MVSANFILEEVSLVVEVVINVEDLLVRLVVM